MLPDQRFPSDEEIAIAARLFRSAIDSAGPEPWNAQYITFPRGACGHASELLGKYLIQRFGITADYVSQNAYESIGGWVGGHAWLEWRGLTIDVTGDQFGWQPVIVTRTPKYHGLGMDHVRHPVCLPHQNDWWIANCGPLWLAIRPFLQLTQRTD